MTLLKVEDLHVGCTLRMLDNALVVVDVLRSTSGPVVIVKHWPVVAIHARNNEGLQPQVGDTLFVPNFGNVYGAMNPITRRMSGSVTIADRCTHLEELPLPCPKVRPGIETRYNVYTCIWEKLMARGWVTAETTPQQKRAQ